jgi:hypothetical protein
VSPAAVLAPVFVQVALSFGLLIALGRVRFAAIRAGAVRIADIALGERVWPARPTQLANAYANQFELPVLLYALAGLALVAGRADGVLVALMWLFVLARLAQAVVAVGTNHVPTRFRCFLAGVLALAAAWTWFAARVLLGS